MLKNVLKFVQMSEQYWGCLDKMSEVNFSPAETLNWMSPVQGKSSLVHVKEQCSNFDMVTCMFSSCNPECAKYACR